MSESVKIGSRKSGGALVRHALEQLPIRYAFGIPGVHNTEIYDELDKSEKIRPVLVTHEGGGAFMAEAISRTAPPDIGCLVIVPAAGATHAMSGIGEAYLDGIPLLVITGGIRTDVEFGYQLHDIDQEKLVSGITKGFWRVASHDQIVPTIFEAYRTAVTGVPGPVFVEIPANIQLFVGDVGNVPAFIAPSTPPFDDNSLLSEAADLLAGADKPGIFVGWGAVDVTEDIAEIAEMLGAPVSTTLQGLSAFRGDHPLHAGMGFSNAAVPAALNAFRDIDALLAVGTRFGEIPTGSFSCGVPEKLVHIDIDPDVLGRNFPVAVGIAADSRVAIPLLVEKWRNMEIDNAGRRIAVAKQIAVDKAAYRTEWYDHGQKVTDRVSPAIFFDALRDRLDDDAIAIVDDGNHTFLTAELFEVRGPRQFVSPTNFDCMGYCVPGAIGAKLVHPDRQVVGIVGDGAFLMTGLEILTAATENVGVAYFVFRDGELAQISQGQEVPYNRKTCTVLGNLQLDGIATATGAKYVAISRNEQIGDGIQLALDTAAGGRPVIVDVNIDYSKRTRFTEGVVENVFKRFPLSEKVRFAGRAMWRRVRRPRPCVTGQFPRYGVSRLAG